MRQQLLICHEFLLAASRSELPMTVRQLTVMTTIGTKPGHHTIRGLAKYIGTPKSAISRAVDTLTAWGFVIRLPDRQDKRSVKLKLTAKGFDYVEELLTKLNQNLKQKEEDNDD